MSVVEKDRCCMRLVVQGGGGLGIQRAAFLSQIFFSSFQPKSNSHLVESIRILIVLNPGLLCVVKLLFLRSSFPYKTLFRGKTSVLIFLLILTALGSLSPTQDSYQ